YFKSLLRNSLCLAFIFLKNNKLSLNSDVCIYFFGNCRYQKEKEKKSSASSEIVININILKRGKFCKMTREEQEDRSKFSKTLAKMPKVKLPNPINKISKFLKQRSKVLSMSDELRRALYANSAISLDVDVIVPDLVGTTEILSDEHREHLCRHLPARAEGYLWTLVFSTSQHGFSLNSMYRKMAKVESPILLVIEDTEGNVFGALTSCSLHVSDHFYGTGESLLFRFTPRFQAFNWTGDNLYFIKGNNESLAIGAGDGKFGLWLDGDLYQGRTQSCSTYGNEPLAPHEDFVVKTLECWAFI
ncbi:Similar to OXR1: Oxidation resistance protein 1 (Homo sapiens), partial [Cotesia congregata]